VSYVSIEVKKQEGESTKSLLRRFTRRIQQSGILVRARKSRFYERPKTRRERRLSALRRDKVVKERDKLEKLGLLNEEETQNKKR
jgi:ribosomal protein S21